MLDIEALGSKPGSVILSIGAVKFAGGKILHEFYRRIDPQSCIDAGLKIDVDTVMWWMKQSKEARDALGTGTMPLTDALDGFAHKSQSTRRHYP